MLQPAAGSQAAARSCSPPLAVPQAPCSLWLLLVGGGWGSSGHCRLSPFPLKHDQIFQGPCGAPCVELTPAPSCRGLLCTSRSVPTCLPSFLCLPSNTVRVVPRQSCVQVPGCVLEVTACPFFWSLCQFPFCFGDESHRCHHVVLWRKGRAELLMVTDGTALGTATSRWPTVEVLGPGAPLSLAFLHPVSHLAGVPRTVSGGISSSLPLRLERQTSHPGRSQLRARIGPFKKGLLSVADHGGRRHGFPCLASPLPRCPSLLPVCLPCLSCL